MDGAGPIVSSPNSSFRVGLDVAGEKNRANNICKILRINLAPHVCDYVLLWHRRIYDYKAVINDDTMSR